MVLAFPHYFLLGFSCCKDMSWIQWNKKQWFAVLQIQCLALADLPLQLMCLSYKWIAQFLLFLVKEFSDAILRERW